MTRTSGHGKWLAASMAAAACMATQLPAHAETAGAPTRSTTCTACHGAQGAGSTTGVPRLAGQNVDYLKHALSSFKAGTRTSPVMQPITSGLEDAEIQELSSYFAGLRGARVPAAAPPPTDLVLAGRALANVGSEPTPPCVSCHGIGGRSDNARFPSLAGQPAAYIIGRLQEFQARARAKAPEPLSMTAVAVHLDEMQIRQVAAYLSTLPPP